MVRALAVFFRSVAAERTDDISFRVTSSGKRQRELRLRCGGRFHFRERNEWVHCRLTEEVQLERC